MSQASRQRQRPSAIVQAAQEVSLHESGGWVRLHESTTTWVSICCGCICQT